MSLMAELVLPVPGFPINIKLYPPLTNSFMFEFILYNNSNAFVSFDTSGLKGTHSLSYKLLTLNARLK